MGSNRIRLFTAVTVAGLSVSLVAAGCAAQPAADPAAAAPSVATSGTTEPTPATAPTSTATATPMAPATSAASSPAAPAPSTEPASPALKNFTFPDGHISFAYPATWTVRTVLPPAGTAPGAKAIVADGAGNDLLILDNGSITGCASAPTSRQVFDQVAILGMTAPDGTEAFLGFAVESDAGGDEYRMGLSNQHLKQGEGVTSGCTLVTTGNGGLSTSVLFNDPGFPDRNAAEAWMATNQYAQLKALLVSLTYA